MYGPEKKVPDYHNSELRDLFSMGYSAEQIYEESFRRGYMEAVSRQSSVQRVLSEESGPSHHARLR